MISIKTYLGFPIYLELCWLVIVYKYWRENFLHFCAVEQNQNLNFNVSRGLLLLALTLPNTVFMGPTERFAKKIFDIKKSIFISICIVLR